VGRQPPVELGSVKESICWLPGEQSGMHHIFAIGRVRWHFVQNSVDNISENE
jgi:hypothetical protein